MAIIKSKSKEFLLLTILLNLGVFVLFGFLFIQIKSANERTSGLLNEIELQSKEEDVLKSLKSLVQETAPLHAKLDTYFVSPEGVASFIGLLEAVGNRIGADVTITSVEKIDTEKAKDVEVLRVVLNATGSWERVIRFLGIIEFLPYQTTVDQVLLTRTAKGWRIDTTISVLKEK